ncbi:hypothetical protein B0H12DRAFT_683073 [Mycena haematopus]|nr:hypothetical protein B0H12DRAFT_683073 [Mycena haematopus]
MFSYQVQLIVVHCVFRHNSDQRRTRIRLPPRCLDCVYIYTSAPRLSFIRVIPLDLRDSRHIRSSRNSTRTIYTTFNYNLGFLTTAYDPLYENAVCSNARLLCRAWTQSLIGTTALHPGSLLKNPQCAQRLEAYQKQVVPWTWVLKEVGRFCSYRWMLALCYNLLST